MYVCMYVCIYIYMCVCVCVCLFIYVFIYALLFFHFWQGFLKNIIFSEMLVSSFKNTFIFTLRT
jgi:hypothetical protein